MAKVKRNKPCGHCKRSKVKCEYEQLLPCKRCVKHGLASSCHFFVKLPSLNLALMGPSGGTNPLEMGHGSLNPDRNPLDSLYRSGGQLAEANFPPNPLLKLLPAPIPSISRSSSTHQIKHLPLQPKPQLKTTETTEGDWRSSMERKLDSVDAKFTDILNALQANKQDSSVDSKSASGPVLNATDVPRGPPSHKHSTTATAEELQGPEKKRICPVDDVQSVRKKLKYAPDDFRENVISMEEAQKLFRFFDEHIAQQLFGFEIKRFRVDILWELSPILICAVCTIALMHYPDPAVSSKQNLLQKHLRDLCASVLFASRPRTEQEAFNTIVSLVLCSFWLSDAQMFTGIALQLAKEFRLNEPPRHKGRSSVLADQDHLKLWYLLFILDGQQSMTYHREALVSSDDYALQNSREMLVNDDLPRLELADAEKDEKKEVLHSARDTPTIDSYQTLTNLRLVSQVEYNIALSESFKGNAWDLLAPKSFGIPSRSNLELDKWMVSWTVLLAPMNNGAVWLSKLTLIYYNFAKMHINSSVIRKLQEDVGGDTLVLPNWKKYQDADGNKITEKEKGNEADAEKPGYGPFLGPRNDPKEDSNSDDSEDDDDDEDFVSNSGLVSQDQALVSFNIAVNAAHTVLNLVLSDPDISNNLKYVPVHIHMMLYYAAILLVNPPAVAREGEGETKSYFADVISKLRMVRSLQKKVYLNLPTDRVFADQLIANLDNLFEERTAKLMAELHASKLDVSDKAQLINETSMLQLTTSLQNSVSNSSLDLSRESSPRPERLSAWPGSHHGHP